MNRILTFTAALLAGLLAACSPPDDGSKTLLVVTVTKGFRHNCIPLAEKILAELARNDGRFKIEYARVDPDAREFANPATRQPDNAKINAAIEKELAAKMSPRALKRYAGVIFCNTTGELPVPDRKFFIDWIRSGRAFIGIHAATDTFHQFPDFIDMIGGQFLTHFDQVRVAANNGSPDHPATRHFGPRFVVFDEIYLLKNFYRNRVHDLLSLDRHPNVPLPGDYPIAWCKQFGQGRVFYTSLGHREDVWENPLYQQHLLGGIRWALGLEPGDAAPQVRRAVLSEEEVREGFRPLFNGVDLTGWRLRHPQGRPSWSAQNGMLVNEVFNALGQLIGPGTDLVTEERFRDFTLRAEYMIAAGGNSGLYLRGRHELQIFDDAARGVPAPDGNGALYSLAAPAAFASRPAGEWQTLEATIIGNRVTATLNGVKIHDHVLVDRPTGGQLDDQVNEPGPIMLQGDHGPVSFRNLRIKVLQ